MERQPQVSTPPPAFAIDARRARRNFDRAAESYSAAAHFEHEVGARMFERLDYVKLAPRRILDAGAGSGAQESRFAQRYRGAQLVTLDFSLPMLQSMRPRGIIERLHARWLGNPAPARVCADFMHLPLAARSCALVWSNMALHWASEVQTAISEFHRVLEVDGLLMFSTLGPDTLKELRAAFTSVEGSPHVHGFIDMHDLGDMLVAAGFAAPVMDTETITLTYSGIDGLIADLRATGQTCALAGCTRGLMGARKWQRVREALQRCVQHGRLPATMEVVYGHAWKAAPLRSAEGHAIVHLDPGSRKRK